MVATACQGDCFRITSLNNFCILTQEIFHETMYLRGAYAYSLALTRAITTVALYLLQFSLERRISMYFIRLGTYK